MKENDVFRFRYKAEAEKKFTLDPYHCFDGQLVVKKNRDGNFILRDTYWSSSDGRCFTPEEAEKEGTLTFVCNLDDVRNIEEWETDYYADEDVYNLSQQHGCYKYYTVKKCAQKSQGKMLQVVRSKIKDEEYSISSSINRIEFLSRQAQKIESGDINVYF